MIYITLDKKMIYITFKLDDILCSFLPPFCFGKKSYPLFKKIIKQCVKELQLFILCLFSSYLFKLLLSKPLKWNLKENNLMNKEKTTNMYEKRKNHKHI